MYIYIYKHRKKFLFLWNFHKSVYEKYNCIQYKKNKQTKTTEKKHNNNNKSSLSPFELELPFYFQLDCGLILQRTVSRVYIGTLLGKNQTLFTRCIAMQSVSGCLLLKSKSSSNLKSPLTPPSSASSHKARKSSKWNWMMPIRDIDFLDVGYGMFLTSLPGHHTNLDINLQSQCMSNGDNEKVYKL